MKIIVKATGRKLIFSFHRTTFFYVLYVYSLYNITEIFKCFRNIYLFKTSVHASVTSLINLRFITNKNAFQLKK